MSADAYHLTAGPDDGSGACYAMETGSDSLASMPACCSAAGSRHRPSRPVDWHETLTSCDERSLMKTEFNFAALVAAAFVSIGAHAQAGAADPWSPAALAARAGAGPIRSEVRNSDGAGYRDEWSPAVLRARFGGQSEGTQGMPLGPGYHDEWSPAALARRFGAPASH